MLPFLPLAKRDGKMKFEFKSSSPCLKTFIYFLFCFGGRSLEGKYSNEMTLNAGLRMEMGCEFLHDDRMNAQILPISRHEKI